MDVAQLPVFQQCDRRTVRRVAEWGDVVEVGAGHVLIRENRGDHWFFVVARGRVELSRAGARIATVTAGSHFGEAAIVGHRPQPATATAIEPSTLFVLGAQPVLSLLADDPAFQQALFPQVPPAGFPEFARRMHEQAASEWRALAAASPAPSARPILPRLAVETSRRPPPAGEAPAPPPPPRPRPSWRKRPAVALAAIAVAILTTLVLIAYHPPRLVVSADRPIDVAGDISITGAPTHRLTGRYLLLSVRTRQPNLAGLLEAMSQGDPTLPARSAHLSPAQQALADRLGHQQFADSQRHAVATAAAMSGVDPRRLTVRFRDRGLVGPSAGLVYALAMTDMLTGHDLVAGRTIAATGAVEPDGRLESVGWVGVKASGAAAAKASVLLVPAGEEGDAFASVAAAYGVSDVSEALLVLQETRPVNRST